MALLKYNRLWKPATDLLIRAKSSKTISSRNQSISASTTECLFDRNKFQNYRQRRIFGHLTNFFGNGPAYYRYYSVGDHREQQLISDDELNQFLKCLENDEPYDGLQVLRRAPYLCTINGEYEQRFLDVFDRWWSRIKCLENEVEWKPTSIVFRLGRLNRRCDGIIIEKLYRLDQLESLEDFIGKASTVDFCSLPNRHDVLNFLAGIHDLTMMDTKFTKVSHPRLRPSTTELFKNLDSYLREKETIRKREYDQNPSVDDSDWIYMIGREAPGIFKHLAFGFRIHYTDFNDFERDLLKRICALIKEGYDYYIVSPTVHNTIDSFGMDYSSFAHAWLLWRVDPDSLVQDIWRSWFFVYQIYSQQIWSDNDLSNVHRFTRCKALLRVCQRFRQIDSFLPVFGIWLDDVRKLSPLVARCDSKQSDFGDVADSFAHLIYDAGQCSKYFALDNQRDFESVFWMIATDALDAFEGKPVDSIALRRYMSGIRDFLSAISKSSGSNISCPTHFNDELLKYLNGWMDDELSKPKSSAALVDISSLILLLSRSKIKLNGDLWRKLLTPLRGESSRRVFDGNEQMLDIIVANFGDAMCHYSCAFHKSCHLRVPNDVMTGYFELAQRLLVSVDPNQAAVEIDKTRYAFTLSIVLSVAIRFRAIAEFEKLKQIWERRMTGLVDRVTSRSAALMVRRMGQLLIFHGVRFDSRLEEKLRRRGEEYERKEKTSWEGFDDY